jgi:ribonuclease T1
MRVVRYILLFIAAIFLLVQHFASVSSPANSAVPSSAGWTQDQSQIPQKAFDVLKIVRETGHAPEGYVGGRRFENREGRLPSGGDYREFDVDPHEGQRNAERIIVDWQTKQAWYTDDHYETFTPMP